MAKLKLKRKTRELFRVGQLAMMIDRRTGRVFEGRWGGPLEGRVGIRLEKRI